MQYVRCYLRSVLYSWHHCEVPVARAADDAKRGTGKICLASDDPFVVLGKGTKFLSEFTPKMQIMLPRSVGSPVAEVTLVVSDTELIIKREFGGENGKVTNRIKEKLDELKAQDIEGLEFKRLPFVDQQETFRHVYQRLTDGACVGIFPEGILDRHSLKSVILIGC